MKITRLKLVTEVSQCMMNLLNSKRDNNSQEIADKLKPLYKATAVIEQEKIDKVEDLTIDFGEFDEKESKFIVKQSSAKYKDYRKAVRSYLQEEIDVDVPSFSLTEYNVEPIYLIALDEFLTK